MQIKTPGQYRRAYGQFCCPFCKADSFIHLYSKADGHSNLTQGRIAAAHRRFNRMRQVAPICTPSSTPNRHPRRTCAGHCWVTVSIYISTTEHVRTCPGRLLLSSNLPLHLRHIDSHLMLTWLLDSAKSISQTAYLRGVFPQLTSESPYTLQ